MTVGMFAGKMLPLHRGHVFVMTQASNMCDELWWGLSHCAVRDEIMCKEKHFSNCPAELRLSWMRTLAKGLPNVKVFEFEDHDDHEYRSWEDGAKEIRKVVGKPINLIFGSEPSYHEVFSRVHPDSEYVLIDAGRDYFPISSTRIRTEGPYKNWHMLPDPVRPHFVKKIVIVGVESCGKSTLVKNLARTFDTVYVEEYGRTVCDELGGIPSLEHYPLIAYGHKMKEREATKTANRVMFIDTEVLTTMYYKRLYCKDYNDDLYIEMAKRQDYDLWILLEPDVPWVADGLRQNGHDREKQHETMCDILNSFGVKYVSIGGTYQERFMKSLELASNILT